jgi:hypothetical protein
MPHSLTEVTSSQVINLGNSFRRIMNKLLRAEAQTFGIPFHAVQTTDNDDETDDGVDARIENIVASTVFSRIPPGLSVWQFKSGPIAPSEIKPETEKRGVQEAICQGGSYCFAVAYNYGDRTRPKRRKVLDDTFSGLGLESKAYFLTATDISEWVSDHPAVAFSREFNPSPRHDGLFTFEEWIRLPQMRAGLEYKPDDTRQRFITQFQELLARPVSISG